MPKNIVIVGASGFVGKNLCKYARSFGCEVLGIEGDDKRFKASRLEDAEYFVGVTLEVCDLYNSGELAAKFHGKDAVYDFVGISSEEGNNTFDKVNVGVTSSVSRACKEAGITRLVYNSGLGVEHYGNHKFPRVQNNYFRSLVEAEKVIKKSGVPYTIFRPSYIIGKDDLFSQRLIKQITNGVIGVVGNGSERLQPIFIKDACEIYLKSADRPQAENRTFNLVGPEKISFMRYVDLLASHVRRTVSNLDLTYRAITTEEATRNYGMSPEQVDIRTCDEVADHTVLETTFGINLKTPKEFLALIYEKGAPITP